MRASRTHLGVLKYGQFKGRTPPARILGGLRKAFKFDLMESFGAGSSSHARKTGHNRRFK